MKRNVSSALSAALLASLIFLTGSKSFASDATYNPELLKFCGETAANTRKFLDSVFFEKAKAIFNEQLKDVTAQDLADFKDYMILSGEYHQINYTISQELAKQTKLVTEKPEGWPATLQESVEKEKQLREQLKTKNAELAAKGGLARAFQKMQAAGTKEVFNFKFELSRFSVSYDRATRRWTEVQGIKMRFEFPYRILGSDDRTSYAGSLTFGIETPEIFYTELSSGGDRVEDLRSFLPRVCEYPANSHNLIPAATISRN